MDQAHKPFSEQKVVCFFSLGTQAGFIKDVISPANLASVTALDQPDCYNAATYVIIKYLSGNLVTPLHY